MRPLAPTVLQELSALTVGSLQRKTQADITAALAHFSEAYKAPKEASVLRLFELLHSS